MDRRDFGSNVLFAAAGIQFLGLDSLVRGSENVYEEYCEEEKREVLLDIVSNIAKYACETYKLSHVVVRGPAFDYMRVNFPDNFLVREEFFEGIKEEDKEKLWKGERRIEIVDERESERYKDGRISLCPFDLGVRVEADFDSFTREEILEKIRKSTRGMALGHAMLEFYLKGYNEENGVKIGVEDGWENLRVDQTSIEAISKNGEGSWKAVFPFRPSHVFYSKK